jgi:2-oxoglutarate ferredoxin oxidoreductase subunit beta
MTHMTKPKARHPGLTPNALGLTHRDYEGIVSTLCAGCGHDSISAAIIQACYELSLPAHKIAKLSGIGCSSKTPNYFLSQSHGFNTVHGRMPSVATGANLANKDLVYVGVSGDGDTASIGLGQFAHVVRRRLNMLYIVENNGTYGLTKGQFSATNDRGSRNKYGVENSYEAIDLASMALQLGAGFVARSFSGDKSQLVPLIKAGLNYEGFAFIDCLSPCVTFNNHDGSTKSFDYVREHNKAMMMADFVPQTAEITTVVEEGQAEDVTLHDGSVVRLRKLGPQYDPYDRNHALNFLQKSQAEGEVPTGLVYLDAGETDLHQMMDTVDKPLNQLAEAELCPGPEQLAYINQSLR